MLLVVDANVLFAAAIKKGTTVDILFSENLEFVAPEYILSEFGKYKEEILIKTERTPDEFDIFFSILMQLIKIVPSEEIKTFLNKASEISPDPDDVPYFALALKYNCPLWSNDSKLKEQESVKVLNTGDLLEFLK